MMRYADQNRDKLGEGEQMNSHMSLPEDEPEDQEDNEMEEL